MRNAGLASFAAASAALAGCSAGPLLSRSANDVGAVLQPISQSNVVDARADFRRQYCLVNEDHGASFPDYRECEEALYRLADESAPSNGFEPALEFRNHIRVIVIPGIFGECLIDEISPFHDAIAHLNQYEAVTAEVLTAVRGRASSEFNAHVIAQYLESLQLGNGEKLIIVAYSKGTTDTLSYLGDQALSSPSVEKISAVVSIAGVVNGSPLADDANAFLKWLARVLPYDECPTQDASGIDDLTRDRQFRRLSEIRLPEHIRYFSLPAFAATESISRALEHSYRRLSLVDPRNDGQVVYYDSIIPGARLLGFANADHWAVALPFSRHVEELGFINRTIARQADENAYPREVLFEAIVRYVDSLL